jgi:curli biogenesis system outer membrane secretion channel CsgG
MTIKTKLIALVLGVLLFSCTKQAQPPVPLPSKARARFYVPKQFRLATFDFGRRAASAQNEKGAPTSTGGLEAAIPAILLTELRESGRFLVYEGGNIRGNGGEALNEKTASEFVDGYLSGTITSEFKDKVCFDVRLQNAHNHEVLFAKNMCAGYSSSANLMQPEREAIKRVAEEISRVIKQVSYGQVVSADGHLVFVNKGKKHDVGRGMVAYLVSTGDSFRDPNVHTLVRDYTGVDPAAGAAGSTPVVVGEIYIVSVEDDFSIGLLFKGDYALPKDTVFFK